MGMLFTFAMKVGAGELHSTDGWLMVDSNIRGFPPNDENSLQDGAPFR